MYSLFIDTHDKSVILALFKDGNTIDESINESNRHHSDILMPSIEDLLSKNKIDVQSLNEILVVNGPGSFTGVRLGVTVAKMLAFTLNIPIKVIDALACMALSCELNNKLCIVRDFKGVFSAFYQNGVIMNEITYLSNEEYLKYVKENNLENQIVEDIPYNFNKIYEYLKNQTSLNPHEVNPLYIKVIEALK